MSGQHSRSKVRDRIIERLRAVPGVVDVVGSRIYPNANDPTKFPYIGVYSSADRVEIASGSHPGRRIVKRTTTIDVFYLDLPPVVPDPEFDESLDAAAAAMESLVLADPRLALPDGSDAFAQDLQITDVQTGFLEDGSPLAAARVRFSAVTLGREGDPSTTLLSRG